MHFPSCSSSFSSFFLLLHAHFFHFDYLFYFYRTTIALIYGLKQATSAKMNISPQNVICHFKGVNMCFIATRLINYQQYTYANTFNNIATIQ